MPLSRLHNLRMSEQIQGVDRVNRWSSWFRGLADAGCDHAALPTGSGRRAAKQPLFLFDTMVLGNIKSAIVGTYKAVGNNQMVRTLAGSVVAPQSPRKYLRQAPVLASSGARTKNRSRNGTSR
jgi:hypothetical protein